MIPSNPPNSSDTIIARIAEHAEGEALADEVSHGAMATQSHTIFTVILCGIASGFALAMTEKNFKNGFTDGY